MTLKKYYDALMAFDWDFGHRAEFADREAHRNRFYDLQQIAKKSAKHRKMFDDFTAYNTLLIRNSKRKPVRPV